MIKFMVAVIVIVLVLLIPSVTGLQCYTCNSNQDPACAYVFNLERFKTSCDDNLVEPYCRKIEQKVNKVKSVVRTCGSKVGSRLCYKSSGANNANVCSCNSDLCNNAINLNRQQRILTIISSILVIALTMIVLR